MNIYTTRLFEEWKKHSKIIIAVDYDSTLNYWNTIENHEDIIAVKKLLKTIYRDEAYTVVFTASAPERFSEIMEVCAKDGIHIDAINTNMILLPYGNTQKIYANIYLDDRAGLKEALEILSEALYLYRGWKQSQNIGQENAD